MRTPLFTLVAVLTLGVGIGANSAIFSLVNAVLLRPLAYPRAHQLVGVYQTDRLTGRRGAVSPPNYFDFKEHAPMFAGLAAFWSPNISISGAGGDPEKVLAATCSHDLFTVLGVAPRLGREFTGADDVPGARRVAVLGHGLWQRRFAADPRVVGRELMLDGSPTAIVGVMPPDFDFPAAGTELWVPLRLSRTQPPNPAVAPERFRQYRILNVVGRLRSVVSLEQSRAEVAGVARGLELQYPDANRQLTVAVVPLHETVVGPVKPALLILLTAVGSVLLIACANVANLLLSRALGRQKEIAVRAALGASRGRIVRQLLTESVLLGLIGGALGLPFAFWILNWIQVLGSKSVPRLHEIAINGEVLLFTLSLSLLSAILFGLVPALRLGALDLNETLKDGTRGSAGAGALWGRGQRTRRALVIAELALSVMLLTGAGLLIRSFARLQQVPPGFNAGNVLTLELTMNGRKYTDTQRVLDTYRELWIRLGRLPGVTAAGAVSALPLSQMMAWGPITVEGRTPPAGEQFIHADIRIAGGDYFRAMEIPLRRGRFFNEQDTRTNPRVVIVDEHMAQQLWPNDDAIGKRIRTGGIDASASAPWMTVVGVVGRIKQDTLDSDLRMAFYYAHTQFPGRAMNVVLRGGVGPDGQTAAVRKEIREVDPDLPIHNVRTMTGRVDESLARRRFSMLLLTIFAVLASGLAALGIYRVMAYFVSQGTRELGIRMALGATPHGIRVLVVRHGIIVAVAGVAIGLAGALVIGRFMRSLLFGIEATDPITFASIALLLGLVALAASYVPARRAARIDPMLALCHE